MTRKDMTKGEIMILEKNEELFNLYALWKSLPIPILSQMSPDQVRNQFGIDDDMTLALTEIKSQQMFSQKYGVHMNTLTDWNKKIRQRDPLYEAKGWAKHLAKNMVIAMYNHALRKGNPAMVKLFFQIVNGWEESSKVKLEDMGDVQFVFETLKKGGNDTTTVKVTAKKKDGHTNKQPAK